MHIPQWKRLRPHPLAELFPPMSEVEFVALKTDMDQNGYDKKQPILICEGKILDGLNRHGAAKETNVQPTFEEYKGNDPLIVVLQRNLHRRHLDASQRAILGGKIANLTHGDSRRFSQTANLQDGENTKKNSDFTPTVKQTAALLNVSERSVSDGHKVVTEGTKELQQAVQNGTLSVSDAAAIADEPAKVQRQAINAVKSGKSRTARAHVGGKHAGASIEEKAKQRLANRGAATAPPANSVTCPMCKGKGHVSAKQAAAAKFIPPTLQEVAAYCKERDNDVDAEAWMDHYISNGWKVGKTPMKDWQAAVRTWERSNFSSNGKKPDPVGSAKRWAEKRGEK